MCGRYYVDDDTAKEIERIIRQVDEKLQSEKKAGKPEFKAKDIHPTDLAPILSVEDDSISCQFQQWGFSSFASGNGTGKRPVVFNARSESALEKPMFRDSVLHRRIVVPATHFYEWNKKKEKNIFRSNDAPVLFMAGCCRDYKDGTRFVILTTGANASMEAVHDRMPLLLKENEIAEWLMDESRTEEFLKKVPPMLERSSDYEQMSLFGSLKPSN